MSATCLEVAVAAGLDRGRESGDEILFRCPRHDDRTPSLSINPKKNVWMCGPCDTKGTTSHLVAFIAGFEPSDKAALRGWFSKHGLSNGKGKIVATYPYVDKNGELLYEMVRYEQPNGKKTFSARRPDGNGGWIDGLGDTRRVLYALPTVLEAKCAFIVEGEKDCNNLATAFGVVATCNPFGARKWRPEYNEPLHGKHIVILPDNDDDGRDHAQIVARNVLPIAKSVRIIELPGLAEKGDISDWIVAGNNKNDFARLLKEAEPLTVASISADELPTGAEEPWPAPLKDAALYGLAGDIVRTLEPHTEADPVAILVQTLAAFGNVAGRNPYYPVEADQHHLNTYVVLVGDTAKGRKGVSKGQVLALFKEADGEWVMNGVKSGLSSGEGLIWAVRDPIAQTKKERGGYERIIADPGTEDKRLLIIEPEFARVLNVAIRPGNTLSAVIRDAWDSGTLRTLTKNSPANATDAHISIVGHITKDELLRCLNSTEAGNGFANRFYWICVRRSKCLPEGGSLREEELKDLWERLGTAVAFAITADKITFDEEARQLWHAVYPALSAGKPGLLGAVTSRAEAQVVRLATLYAVMDCCKRIKKVHLDAALAVWEYAEASAKYIFGGAIGDPVADEILAVLRRCTGGMTRTEISGLFSRHVNVGPALATLLRLGYVERRMEETGGRPTERWFASTPDKEGR